MAHGAHATTHGEHACDERVPSASGAHDCFFYALRTQFDGVCNLCDGFINFVADHDSERRVKFGAQQKHVDLLARVGAPLDLSTVVLIQGDTYTTKSTAALRTIALMDWPWSALAAAHALPAVLRDWGYGMVAAHRYRLFGKVESCRVPSGDFRKRFIDYRPEEEEPADPISAGISSGTA